MYVYNNIHINKYREYITIYQNAHTQICIYIYMYYVCIYVYIYMYVCRGYYYISKHTQRYVYIYTMGATSVKQEMQIFRGTRTSAG